MTEAISWPVAFGAGLLSFLSPCVLPLLPVYLASLYGPEIFDGKASRVRLPLLLHAASFVAGFSLFFGVLGALAGLTGSAVSLNLAMLNKIAGGLLIAFGLFILAARKVSWLNYELRLSPPLGRTSGYLRSFTIGAVFSLGWTACVGPILAGILALAAMQATAGKGAALLAIYSLGLGLPFLVLSLAFDTIAPVLRQFQRHAALVQMISGLLLIITGVLVLTNRLAWLVRLSA